VDTVKEIRRRKGWSQKDLAEKSGVGQDTISGIESGRHEPRPSTLRKLADALDVEVADFFREPAFAEKAEASTTRRPRMTAERALEIADSDSVRREAKGASVEELQQTALELAQFTKPQTRDNPSSHEEAYRRVISYERLGIIEGVLAQRGAPSPIKLVMERFNDATTPTVETTQRTHEEQEGRETA
jgi:transcriptional regulator with XRE-family HTH domain